MFGMFLATLETESCLIQKQMAANHRSWMSINNSI